MGAVTQDFIPHVRRCKLVVIGIVGSGSAGVHSPALMEYVPVEYAVPVQGGKEFVGRGGHILAACDIAPGVFKQSGLMFKILILKQDIRLNPASPAEYAATVHFENPCRLAVVIYYLRGDFSESCIKLPAVRLQSVHIKA